MTIKSTSWANGLLELLLNNSDYAGVGDAGGLRGSVAAGSLYVALHTAALSAGDAQNVNEATYTSYARVAVARSGAQWTVTNNDAQNANEIAFPEATGGSETITHVSIGVGSAGATVALYTIALTTPRLVNSGITPRFVAGALTLTEAELT